MRLKCKIVYIEADQTDTPVELLFAVVDEASFDN